MTYVDLLLPVPLQRLFTYEVPPSMENIVRRGCRALVQFGKKKFYAGIVMEVHDREPGYETKPISEIVDTEPIVTEGQLRLWQWIADYYICTLGEVMKAAMPQGLKLESESKLMYNAQFETGDTAERAPLTPRQAEALDFIREKKVCTISDVASHLGGVNPIGHIRALLDCEAIYISEELRDSYKPKKVKAYSLGRDLRSEDAVYAAMDSIEKRAPRQMEALMAFLQAAGGTGKATEGHRVRVDAAPKLREFAAQLTELTRKGVLAVESVEVSRLATTDAPPTPPNALTEIQEEALRQVEESMDTGRPTLLYGVTGSGKTEIYIHLIDKAIKEGKNILYLLPEIALTTQITERLRRHFGDLMAVYHSKFSDSERVEVWKKLLSATPPRIILGVRSSILLPLTGLGLIIVDEEHEGSFKQYDPAPRYNARDMAIVLSGLNKGCGVVLGSATPSLESWANVEAGRYGLVKLTQRHAGLELPAVEVIDMAEARRKKATRSMFSLRLKEVIDGAISRREQVILFQNRRGFSPVVECKQCAMVPKCLNCDVSLTYHKATGQLVCHYCGYSTPMPTTCPACGNPTLAPQGFGTEKIEEECKTLFPQARVARMDLDTARSRKQFEEIISHFAAREYDILIGTQMVAKGLDFEGVSTVGIMNADALMSMSDFRADERAYQLMAQVSGRAGRKGSQGHVYIQVSRPDHPVIESVRVCDYEGNAARLMEERRAYHFPPFYRLMSLTVKHRDQATALDAARTLSQWLKAKFGNTVSEPVQPPVGRVSNLYLQEITIKMPRTASPSQVKAMMMDDVNKLLAEQQFKAATVRIDVDPY
ncbi:MAG: primosomal protein N' [Marinilabiliaceae bacterium]